MYFKSYDINKIFFGILIEKKKHFIGKNKITNLLFDIWKQNCNKIKNNEYAILFSLIAE